MEIILLTLAGPVVSYVTELLKKLKLNEIFAGEKRRRALRLVVALLSALSAFGASILDGNGISYDAVSTFFEAIAIYLAATIPYELGKQN